MLTLMTIWSLHITVATIVVSGEEIMMYKHSLTIPIAKKDRKGVLRHHCPDCSTVNYHQHAFPLGDIFYKCRKCGVFIT